MIEKAAKENILTTAMDMLREMPMQQVTIREIAKRAKVNIAAVSYYFSSKESLLAQALDTIIQTRMTQWVSQLVDQRQPTQTDLINFLLMLHQACVDQPDFAKTRVYSSLSSQSINQANLSIYTALFSLLRHLYPTRDESQLRLQTSLFFSSLVALSCSSQEMSAYTGMALTQKEALEEYVRQLIKLILPS